MGKKFQTAPVSAVRKLQEYSWPGNIRELENIIERAVISSPLNHLNFEIPSEGKINNETEEFNLERLDREHIQRVLNLTAWIIEGPKGAACLLGLNPGTLRSRMLKLGIRRPGKEGNERQASASTKT
jgi:transcriptional regulator with GAF, ATPase, and Fis domain